MRRRQFFGRGAIAVLIGVAMVVAACSSGVILHPIVGELEVSPATVSVTVGKAVQLVGRVLDESGVVIEGHVVRWTSENIGIATVNESGLVTGVGAGSTSVTAATGGLTFPILVQVTTDPTQPPPTQPPPTQPPPTQPPPTQPPPPPPPPAELTDLPLATGQVPLWQRVRFPAAGGSYFDPTTGVRVWRVTDGATDGGAKFQHYYATANHISRPDETGTYRVLFLRDGGGIPTLADIRRGVGVSNVRAVSIGAVQRASFSRVSPHILYYVSGNTVNRFNVRTMTLENIAPFPKTLPRGNIESLLVSENDDWFTFMGTGSSQGMVGWNRTNDRVITNGISASDQYALTAGGYVMVVAGSIHQWNLSTGAMEATGLSAESTVEHPDGAGGFFVARDAGRREVYRFDPTTKVRTKIFGADGHTNGSQHFSGRWYQGSGTNQWALGSFFGGDQVGLGSFSLHSGQIYRTTASFDWAEDRVGAVLKGSTGSGRWLDSVSSLGAITEGSFFWDGAGRVLYVWQPGGGVPAVSARAPGAGFHGIMFFRLDGSEKRLLAHHFSSAAEYYAQPHAQVAQDGGLVMWTSDMNGSARRDVFVAEVPR